MGLLADDPLRTNAPLWVSCGHQRGEKDNVRNQYPEMIRPSFTLFPPALSDSVLRRLSRVTGGLPICIICSQFLCRFSARREPSNARETRTQEHDESDVAADADFNLVDEFI